MGSGCGVTTARRAACTGFAGCVAERRVSDGVYLSSVTNGMGHQNTSQSRWPALSGYRVWATVQDGGVALPQHVLLPTPLGLGLGNQPSKDVASTCCGARSFMWNLHTSFKILRCMAAPHRLRRLRVSPAIPKSRVGRDRRGCNSGSRSVQAFRRCGVRGLGATSITLSI